ncbi:MAG: DNA mismatch repair endonuclease MutL [Ktedonobacterales bacterium]
MAHRGDVSEEQAGAGRIRELPPEVVERIAAGEMIERPASVVRELIDNALDAGATSIRIELREGGLRLIRVADDGSGIPGDDLERACQPHTTSKVRSLADLEHITTLGFRGEALASIAVVAELTLASAFDASGVGEVITLRPGQPTGREHLSRGRGTTVTIRRLFQQMPARRALLRGPGAEAGRILALVRAYALAHPAVCFTLTDDGALLLQTPGTDLTATVPALYGADVAHGLLPLAHTQLTGAELDGFVTARAFSFATREHVFLVVNGRPIVNRALLAAAEAGYRPLLRKGRHPLLIAHLNIDTDRVDVNVHPAKAEALLRDETTLAAALRQAIHDALGSAPADVTTMTSRPTAPRFTYPMQLHLPAPRMARRRGLRVREGKARYGGVGSLPLWRNEYDESAAQELPELEPLGQFDNTLIVAQSPQGKLFLVDQHRAHERILYERLLRQRVPTAQTDQAEGDGDIAFVTPEAPLPGQLLLEPLLVELTPAQAETLSARLVELSELGLECQPFGGSVFLVRSLPNIPGAVQSATAFVQTLAQDAAEEVDDWLDAVCVSLACRSAIRRGQPLTLAEQRALLADLHETSAAAVCPHGSPLVVYYSRELLTRLFEW